MTDCGFGRSRCEDGRCFYPERGYKCPEEECFLGQDQECQNKIQCYWSWYDVCDGERSCDDDTDELGCPSKESTSNNMKKSELMKILIIIMFVVAFLLFVGLGMAIFKRRGRRRQAQMNASSVNLRPTHPGLSTQTLNIQLQPPQYYALDDASETSVPPQCAEDSQPLQPQQNSIATEPPSCN